MIGLRPSDRLTESLLLFGALFLPGYLAQGAGFDPSLLYQVSYNLSYLVSTLPQIMLLVYLAARRGEPERYGLTGLRPADVPLVLIATVLLLAVAVPIGLVSSNALGPGAAGEPASPDLLTTLLVAVTAVATGYREECFYRSMLYEALRSQGASASIAVSLASLLFAAGHVYQGVWAFVGSALMAVILHGVFLRRRNIHIVGLAHGLYNFLILMTLPAA